MIESDGDEDPGETKERKTKARWLDNIKNKLSERELSGGAQYRVQGRRLIHTRNIDPTQKWQRVRKKKKML